VTDARPIPLPAGFGCHVANVGVKDDTDDFVVIAAGAPVAAAGVFTRSRFIGPSVTISREHLLDGWAQAVVIVAKNANVANGRGGEADAEALVAAVAGRLGCAADDVLIASTGVIGRRYPLERILAGVAAMPAAPDGTDAVAAARAIMTTDTVPKVAGADVGGGPARVVGFAKGVGMIEPDMATMIAVLLTDAAVEAGELDQCFRRVVERTFNCVSIDTDTSTSDTAVVLASGAAGPVELEALETAIGAVAESLTRQIARDGEGAETLIEVHVDRARDREQAKRVAKAIVNSPLVKAAVHGADPNWGRVAMAIGKCQDDTDIEQDLVVIRFGEREVYPAPVSDSDLAELADYLRGDEVLIHVSLGTGTADCTVWGCDLTAGYVRINADYTS
jgi:glutamate N-acetyltransferase / amino-acid N-acetyltransferase